MRLENSGEVGWIGEARSVHDLRYCRVFLRKQLAGSVNPIIIEIIREGFSGYLFKKPAEGSFGKPRNFGDIFQFDRVLVMLRHKFGNGVNPRIIVGLHLDFTGIVQ